MSNGSLLQRLSRSLYWRVSLIFFLVLTALAGTYLYISAETADLYFQESSQRLNRDIAAHIVQFSDPFVEGAVNEAELKETFHNVMVLNPSLEVYLLDKTGKILTYYAPKSKVKLESVDLTPIKHFIADTSGSLIVGDDPRHPGESKVFSAAPIEADGQLEGYIYTVLASEEYTSISEMVIGSYRLRLAGTTMLLAFVAALITGLVILWLLTRNLNKIISIVKRFQNGDHDARIHLRSRGELTQLANDFNSMADTIVKYISEIRSVEELRRELIANVSHDLRTPLASIQGYAETLVMKFDRLDDTNRMKYLETILDGTERIKKLVDDLFELSKLETRQVQANFEYFSLQELVHDIARKYELIASQQEIKIETEIQQDLPQIYADIALIDRVLQNLVDNALKYTPKQGKIRIEIKSEREQLKVMVADTGLGIKADELPYIFERYSRGKSPRKDGVGLGLAIVKKILEMHHSSITVDSKVDKGTTFAFNLPTQPLS